MTVAAVEATASTGGVQAALARIAELEALVARAQGVPTAPAATPAPAPLTGGATFPAALATATAPHPVLATAATAPLPAHGPASLGGAPTPYDGLIAAAAARHGLDPALLKGLIRAESNFNPTATSPAGAVGLAQLMPGTAAALGVADPTDPAQSIDGGARYLRQQLDAFGGDVTLALAAYNAGPGAVRRYGGVPPYAETQAYVQRVQAYAAEYRVPATAPVAAPSPVSPWALASIPTTGSGTIT